MRRRPGCALSFGDRKPDGRCGANALRATIADNWGRYLGDPDSNKEKQIWVIGGKKTKAGGNNRKRPSLIQRKNEKRKKKRRNKCPVILFVCHFFIPFEKGTAIRPEAKRDFPRGSNPSLAPHPRPDEPAVNICLAPVSGSFRVWRHTAGSSKQQKLLL